MSIIREDNTMRITFEEDTWKQGEEGILSVTDGTTPFYSADTWTEELKLRCSTSNFHRATKAPCTY